MILLSSRLKMTTVSISFFLEIEMVTTKIVNSKSLKKICRQLLSTMNVLKDLTLQRGFSWAESLICGRPIIVSHFVIGQSSYEFE